MKKFLIILGGITMTSSIGSSVVSCQNENQTFNLTSSIGEVKDTFNKNDVEDYYFAYFDGQTPITTEVVINFKSTGLKNYGQISGGVEFYLRQLVKGLGQYPQQQKYGAKEIPDWAWREAGITKPN